MAMENIAYTVPENNKEVFVYPAMDRISEILSENRRKVHKYGFEINGVPFQILRDKTREELLHKAVQYTDEIKSLLRKTQYGSYFSVRNSAQISKSSQTTQNKLSIKGFALNCESIKNIAIIQTGHEPIFYYPGIWIKNHLVHYLAKKLGGIGVNMIVDNDSCKTGFMYAPILSEIPASIQKVALVENKDKVAYEEVLFDDFETILRFKEKALALLKKNVFDENAKTTVESMQNMFKTYINCIEECYQQGCFDMTGLLTSARKALEADFRIDNLEIPVSWICDTDGFYHFLLHILYNAGQFVKIYNEKLAEYRSIHKIRSKANPLPDLTMIDNLVEIPFWVWEKGEPRCKCYMLDDGETIKITNGKDAITTITKNEKVEANITRLKTLVKSNIKIRPRAITTTMFSRLFFSDVFIHGIGGAKYDMITDEIIKEFFCVEPPAFMVISATLFLPFDTSETDNKTLQTFRHEFKDMVYNPERHASKVTQNDTRFINLLGEKQRLLKMMPSSGTDEKKQYFNRIKELNKLMFELIPVEYQNKEREISRINNNLAFNAAVRFREYPVCIYPMKVLKDYFLNAFS